MRYHERPLKLDDISAVGIAMLIKRSHLDGIGHGNGLNLLDVRAQRDRGLGAQSTAELGRVAHGHGLAVREAVDTCAAGDDGVANVSLEGSVLVEDGLPVGLDVANAAGHILVVDRDNGLLSKVLLLAALGVTVRHRRILVVVGDPDVAG